MNKVVIIGAGKTGRGFIGRLAAEAGCEIRFVDANQELVDRLNNAGKFEVSFFGGVRENVTVSSYTACTWEEEIENALTGAAFVIADPLFKPICPDSVKFIELPSESFSGRIYREQIPNLVTGFSQFFSEVF